MFGIFFPFPTSTCLTEIDFFLTAPRKSESSRRDVCTQKYKGEREEKSTDRPHLFEVSHAVNVNNFHMLVNASSLIS